MSEKRFRVDAVDRCTCPCTCSRADERPLTRADAVEEIVTRHGEQARAMIDGRSDAFVFGWHAEMQRQRARIEQQAEQARADNVERGAPKGEEPIAPKPRRKLGPLPNSLDSRLTEAEKALPPSRRPLPGQLARRKEK